LNEFRFKKMHGFLMNMTRPKINGGGVQEAPKSPEII
jgi:hypothetical protein